MAWSTLIVRLRSCGQDVARRQLCLSTKRTGPGSPGSALFTSPPFAPPPGPNLHPVEIVHREVRAALVFIPKKAEPLALPSVLTATVWPEPGVGRTGV